jgi:hypothetical protein
MVQERPCNNIVARQKTVTFNFNSLCNILRLKVVIKTVINLNVQLLKDWDEILSWAKELAKKATE